MSTLTNLFAEIADAIRTKKGTTDLISAKNFAAEILNLPTGGITGELFFKSIIPTKSWTSLNSSYNEYSATNDYGDWKISSNNTPKSSYRLSYCFDDDLETKYLPTHTSASSGGSEIIIEFPKLINPKCVYMAYNNLAAGYIQGYNPETQEWENLINFSKNSSTSSSSMTKATLEIDSENFYSKIRIPVLNAMTSSCSIYEFNITGGIIKEE